MFQFGRRVICPCCRNVLANRCVPIPGGTRTCDHWIAVEHRRCDARLYVYSPVACVHYVVTISATQKREIEERHLSHEAALAYLGVALPLARAS